MKLNAIKHQGVASRQTDEKLPSITEVNKESDDSERQVQRYIRLTHLIPELPAMVDDGKIAFSIGVELSYLEDQLQHGLLNEIELNNCTPSYAQSVCMHKTHNSGTLNRDGIKQIMSEMKANQRETVKVSAERLQAVVPKGMDAKRTEDFIIKTCEHYRRYLQHQRDAR